LYYGATVIRGIAFPRERGVACTNAAEIARLGRQETSAKQKAGARAACVAGA